RNALILEYMPIVYSIAEKVAESLPYQVQIEDIVSTGVFGLIDAIDAYDITRGVTFETFSSRRVHGAMMDGLREVDWVPRQTRTRMKKYNKLVNKFESDKGRQPTEDELAVELGVPVSKMRNIINEIAEAAIYSFEDSAVTGDEDNFLRNAYTINDPTQDNPLKLAEDREVIDMIDSYLSERERMVVIMYYIENLTMDEISQKLNVCESRVSQIHKSAIDKLRKVFAPELVS
ncbi:MAG: FliA/WhiG family RNA polymerase sigma factor, partial [Planctomycetota bacterium]